MGKEGELIGWVERVLVEGVLREGVLRRIERVY